MVTDTRDRLVDSALRVLSQEGLTRASARVIAAAAGVNQALVFYHFGSVDGLLAEACRRGTQARIALYHDRFAAVSSLSELLAVGRVLHAAEQAEGTVAVLAQLLAGAQTDAKLAPVVADGLAMWVAEIEAVVRRLTANLPVTDLLDVPGLSRAIAAAFIGLELYDGVDPGGATAALDALGKLAVLVEVLDDLGPVARRTLRAKIAKAVGR